MHSLVRYKRLEAGKFIWPVSRSGEAVQISAAQLGYLLEGIDWRNPRWTQRPTKAACYTTPDGRSRSLGIRVGMMHARLPHANAFRNMSKPVRNQDLA